MSNDDKINAIWQAVTRLDHAILGNGRPGLLDRTTVLEIMERDCPAREAFKTDSRRASLANLIAAAALVVSVFAIWFAKG